MKEVIGARPLRLSKRAEVGSAHWSPRYIWKKFTAGFWKFTKLSGKADISSYKGLL